MVGNKVQLCSFCRLLFTTACQRNLLLVRRKWLLPDLPVVSRPISTSVSLCQDKGDNVTTGSDESSSGSSSDSSSDSESDVETTAPPKGSTDRVEVQKDILSTSSLLDRLKNPDLNPISETVKFARPPPPPSKTDLDPVSVKTAKSQPPSEPVIDPAIASAARSVAESLPGDTVKTESALLGKLLTQMEVTVQQKEGQTPSTDEPPKEKTFSDVMEGMSVMKEKQQKRAAEGTQRGPSVSKGQRERWRGDNESEIRMQESFRPPGIGLLSGKPLGIFSKDRDSKPVEEKRSLFDVVEEEMRLQAQTWYTPRNAFEEQIQWTREGKLWTFPIDNETGWEEEKTTGFHEHVFLEHKLADFPRKGPIRHFMELVITALSKNPYLTVQQKHENIDWYKQYFIDKQTMLEEQLGESGRIQSQDQPAEKIV